MTASDTHHDTGADTRADTQANTDPEEVEKFDALAARWWDPDGAFKPLHDINPLRLAFVEASVDGGAGLAGKTVLDVGCGGGILAEAMASRGAAVTGIDASEGALATARLHLKESGVDVDYIHTTGEQMADERPGAFDVVTCMELLEHVPDPASLVGACARLVRPGGEVVFSTINRNPKAYLLAAGLAGLSGIITLCDKPQTHVTLGSLMELEAIASAVIGGCILTGGRGSVIGALIGAFIITSVRYELIALGAPSAWFITFVGIVLIVAVLFNQALSRWLLRSSA